MATRVWGLSKKEADYRPARQPDVRCDHCTYMFPRTAFGGCRLVRGTIPRHHRDTTATAFGELCGKGDLPICRDSA